MIQSELKAITLAQDVQTRATCRNKQKHRKEKLLARLEDDEGIYSSSLSARCPTLATISNFNGQSSWGQDSEQSQWCQSWPWWKAELDTVWIGVSTCGLKKNQISKEQWGSVKSDDIMISLLSKRLGMCLRLTSYEVWWHFYGCPHQAL